jgi:hypothetical protein
MLEPDNCLGGQLPNKEIFNPAGRLPCAWRGVAASANYNSKYKKNSFTEAIVAPRRFSPSVPDLRSISTIKKNPFREDFRPMRSSAHSTNPVAGALPPHSSRLPG